MHHSHCVHHKSHMNLRPNPGLHCGKPLPARAMTRKCYIPLLVLLQVPGDKRLALSIRPN
jgi:hypothetical protein